MVRHQEFMVEKTYAAAHANEYRERPRGKAPEPWCLRHANASTRWNNAALAFMPYMVKRTWLKIHRLPSRRCLVAWRRQRVVWYAQRVGEGMFFHKRHPAPMVEGYQRMAEAPLRRRPTATPPTALVLPRTQRSKQRRRRMSKECLRQHRQKS